MVHTHLVTWQEFLREKDNKDLPITEAKAKYLKLQQKFNLLMEAEVAAYNAVALNSVIDGSQGGDPAMINAISNLVFSTTPLETDNAATTLAVTATFQYPVLVTGVPSLKVFNNQKGGGSASQNTLTYDSGNGTRSIVFQLEQASANTDGTGVFGCGKLQNSFQDGSGIDVVAAISANTLTGVNTAGSIFGAAFTGAGGATAENGTADVTFLADGTITAVIIASISDDAASYYITGDTLTFASSEFTAVGASGGSLVVTIDNNVLTGDTFDIPTAVETVIGNAQPGVIAVSSDNFITTEAGEKLGYQDDTYLGTNGYLTYSSAVLGGAVTAQADTP